MERRYRDKFGVVHVASDLGLGNRITLCERSVKDEWYDTRELVDTEDHLTCVFCLCASPVRLA
jgi:hypothetical protein